MVKLSILQRCLMTSRGSFSSLTQRDLNSLNHFVDIYGSQWSNNNNNDINHNLSGNPAVCRASTGGWAKLYCFFLFLEVRGFFQHQTLLKQNRNNPEGDQWCCFIVFITKLQFSSLIESCCYSIFSDCCDHKGGFLFEMISPACFSAAKWFVSLSFNKQALRVKCKREKNRKIERKLQREHQ